MDLNAFMEDFANEIGGQYSEYDKSKSVIIVPLADNRYQAVVGRIKYSERYDRTGVEFTSKVCPLSANLKLEELLRANGKFSYAKFMIDDDDFVKIESSVLIEDATPHLLKEVIQETAKTADEWEFRLTGMDVH